MRGNMSLSPTEVLEILQEGLKSRFGDVDITSVRLYSYEKSVSMNLSDLSSVDIEFGEEE